MPYFLTSSKMMKSALVFLLFALAFVCLECTTRLMIYFGMPGLPTQAAMVALRTGGGESVPDWLRPITLHPYLGFVTGQKPQTKNQQATRKVNRFGWRGAEPTAATKERPFQILVTGGSVAGQLLDVDTQLTTALRQITADSGKPIEVTYAAVGGYKQPQQLLTLTYLLALDLKPDLLINLDGFNDIALPLSENWKNGVALHYPRSWRLLVRDHFDYNLFLTGRSLYILRNLKKSVKQLAGRFPFRKSAFLLASATLVDQSLTKLMLIKYNRLENQVGPAKNFAASGPGNLPATQAAVLAESANIWQQASVQMSKLCAANGIPYLHFLQPNQYVPGSKPVGSEERAAAFGPPDYTFRVAVEQGYPELRSRGESLKQSGIHFFDLSLLFKTREEPLYIDTCCHLNKVGLALLVDAMSDRIIKTLSAEKNLASPRPRLSRATR